MTAHHGDALAISDREYARLQIAGDDNDAIRAAMGRIFWRRLYRELRLTARAEAAQFEHEILYGRPTQHKPLGIIHSTSMAMR